MSIVNFALSRPLEQKINQIIKKDGFASKAEFFRFAAMKYIQNLCSQDIFQEELDEASRSLSNTLTKVSRKKKFSALKEQFADLR